MRRRAGGVVVQVGNLPGKAVPASLGDLVTREITWIGSYRFVDEITDAVAAMENGLDVTSADHASLSNKRSSAGDRGRGRTATAAAARCCFSSAVANGLRPSGTINLLGRVVSALPFRR